MLRGYKELWLALLAMLLITGLYGAVYAATQAIPPAYELFGHGIGIIGFILMLMTETLYSLRKRSRSVKWGRMSTWLQSHIFMGLVGPFMVLLHSSWKFNGLAGASMLLDSHNRDQRVHRPLYLHPHPAYDGRPGDRRDALAGGTQTGAPADGALAHDPHPDRDGALCDGLCPYQRSLVLRHAAQIGRRYEKKQSPGVPDRDGADRRHHHSAYHCRICLRRRRIDVQPRAIECPG